MGFAGTSLVVATHVEVAFSHTGGMPVGLHSFCLSSRRATARIHPDGRVEFRTDPSGSRTTTGARASREDAETFTQSSGLDDVSDGRGPR